MADALTVANVTIDAERKQIYSKDLAGILDCHFHYLGRQLWDLEYLLSYIINLIFRATTQIRL